MYKMYQTFFPEQYVEQAKQAVSFFKKDIFKEYYVDLMLYVYAHEKEASWLNRFTLLIAEELFNAKFDGEFKDEFEKLYSITGKSLLDTYILFSKCLTATLQSDIIEFKDGIEHKLIERGGIITPTLDKLTNLHKQFYGIKLAEINKNNLFSEEYTDEQSKIALDIILLYRDKNTQVYKGLIEALYRDGKEELYNFVRTWSTSWAKDLFLAPAIEENAKGIEFELVKELYVSLDKNMKNAVALLAIYLAKTFMVDIKANKEYLDNNITSTHSEIYTEEEFQLAIRFVEMFKRDYLKEYEDFLVYTTMNSNADKEWELLHILMLVEAIYIKAIKGAEGRIFEALSELESISDPITTLNHAFLSIVRSDIKDNIDIIKDRIKSEEGKSTRALDQFTDFVTTHEIELTRKEYIPNKLEGYTYEQVEAAILCILIYRNKYTTKYKEIMIKINETYKDTGYRYGFPREWAEEYYNLAANEFLFGYELRLIRLLSQQLDRNSVENLLASCFLTILEADYKLNMVQ